MAVSRAPGIPSIAEMAEDRLWERKIRMEYQELQEKIENIAAIRDKDIDIIVQKCQSASDLYETGLGRMKKLELAIADNNVRVDGMVEEMKQFMQRTLEFLKIRLSDKELEGIRCATIPGLKCSSPSLRALNPEDEDRISTESLADSLSARPPPRPSNRRSSYIAPELSQTSSFVFNNPQIAGPSDRDFPIQDLSKRPSFPAEPVTSDPPTSSRKRPIATRPTNADTPRPPPMMTRNRSKTNSGENAAQAPPAPRPPKIPRLSQHRRPLMVYYEDATAIHNSLELEAGQPEFDFVSAFIAGISSKMIANKLVDSLANFCACDTKEDGSREIFCEWHEIMEGMKNAGLDVSEQGDQGKGKAKAGIASVAAGMPNTRNSRAAGDPHSKEEPVAAVSRGSRHLYVVDHEVEGRGGKEPAKKAGRSEPSGGRSTRAAVNKPKLSHPKSSAIGAGSGPSKAKGSGASTGNRRAGRTVVEKPGLNKDRAVQSAAGGGGPSGGLAVIGGAGGGGGHGNGNGVGSRRDPRVTKR